MISFGLDEEQGLIQATVRAFAADVMRPAMRSWERAGELPASVRRAFHELSLGLLDVPEVMGGSGQPLLTSCLVHEELAFGDPAGAIALWSPHHLGAAMAELASDEQGRALLAPFAATEGAERLGALAWSEPSSAIGTNADGGFATRAVAVDGGWRLDGQKRFVVNAGRAQQTVVLAQVEPARGWDGIGAFVVEAGTPGLTVGAREALLGLDVVPVGALTLDGVVVPASHRLDGRGDLAAALGRLLLRVSLVGAARQVGLARAAYEYALGYTQERHAFGKPVAHFQSVAFTLAEMHMDVESARWMVWRAAAAFDRSSGQASGRAGERVDAGGPAGAFDAATARLVCEAAVHANRAAFRAANDGVQLLGGAGFIRDFPSEKWLREARALALCGPSDEHLLLVAGALLAGDASPSVLFPSAGLQPMVT